MGGGAPSLEATDFQLLAITDLKTAMTHCCHTQRQAPNRQRASSAQREQEGEGWRGQRHHGGLTIRVRREWLCCVSGALQGQPSSQPLSREN